ncbi:MAG TPA: hypothetical protein DGH14_10415, partial [Roseburia sp.]|nr:hypothetical protein [Roseburia sp.]
VVDFLDALHDLEQPSAAGNTVCFEGSAVFSAVSAYYGQMYGALKKSWNSMASTVVAALVNIVANYYFIPRIGINGAVIGTVLAYIALMLVRMVDVGKYISLSIDYRRFALNCIVVMLQGLLVSNDFHIVVTSILSLIAFAIINWKTLMTSLRIGTIKYK